MENLERQLEQLLRVLKVQRRLHEGHVAACKHEVSTLRESVEGLRERSNGTASDQLLNLVSADWQLVRLRRLKSLNAQIAKHKAVETEANLALARTQAQIEHIARQLETLRKQRIRRRQNKSIEAMICERICASQNVSG